MLIIVSLHLDISLNIYIYIPTASRGAHFSASKKKTTITTTKLAGGMSMA